MKRYPFLNPERPLGILMLVVLMFFLLFNHSYAQDELKTEADAQTLPPVNVVEEPETATTITPPTSAVGTKETIDRTTIEVQGGAEQISPYKAMSMQPGVDIRTSDAFGMELSHRIRGKSDRNIGETVEGLPIKGIGPGGGLSTMIDLENVQSIALSKGAVSADSGFGYGSDNGMVDMQMRRPVDEAHGTVKQALGSDAFTRTYLRLDTGKMGQVAKAFVSGSYTEADKWKGAGDSPDGRKNVVAGLSSTAGQPIQWELYGIHNEDRKHSYKGLTFEQSLDLSANQYVDYNTELTGDSTTDADYYDYNRQDFRTSTVFGKISLPLTGNASLTLKPYYLHDEGFSYSGSNGRVVDWLVEHDTMGAYSSFAMPSTRAKSRPGTGTRKTKPPAPPPIENTAPRRVWNFWAGNV